MSINNIFYVILSIVSILVTGVLIPLLKQKYGQDKVKSVMDSVTIAVRAAEQIYTKSGQGNLKKQYVLQYLNDKNIKISDAELDTMIESAVLELNRWKDEIEKDPPVVNLIETKEYVEKK
ncbi:type II secretory pathway pseudopilin PulG [Peptoniphilus olsenii]|uniref:Type II secretory pathway pseudopilin PulG n=1 Tax=Peptoniphilus olsenii TaxID=411570 RepID=A0ABV2J7F3_9FIRM